MSHVSRIGVSIEPDLLEKLDAMVNEKGYPARSEAIRDLVRRALSEERLKDPTAPVVGTITLVYEHHKGGVRERLMDVQHENHHLISASIHVHLDLERCLEVLVVKGTMEEVRELTEQLTAVKGVVHGLPVTMVDEPSEAEKNHVHGHAGHEHPR
jgi:CopG family nickel-responsive transcriptional regulator